VRRTGGSAPHPPIAGDRPSVPLPPAHEAVPRRGLAGYVPSIAAEWAEVRGSERWQVVDGTLCLVDVSGSTALFERPAAQGGSPPRS
jgi:hypothetical protein